MAEDMNIEHQDAYRQFETWLLEQPEWLQDATYRLYHFLPVDDKEIQRYANMCILKSSGKNIEFHKFEGYKNESENSTGSFSLQKIFNVQDVNALSPKAEIEFAPDKLNIVYGLNGSGKTGFMRIIKKASNNTYAEKIQPNVYQTGKSNKPCCNIQVLQNGTEETINVNLSETAGEFPLERCDVFDPLISLEYIRNETDVSYQPFVFSVLSELSNIADKIKDEIKERKEKLVSIPLNIPEEYRTKEYSRWLYNISFETIIPEECQSWTQKEESEMESLSLLVDTEKTQEKLKSNISILKTLDIVLSDLKTITDQLSQQEKDNLTNARINLQGKKEAFELAQKMFSEETDENDKISASSLAWQNMWKSAKSYYEEVEIGELTNKFAMDGSICPLCHQKVTGAVSKRMTSINNYVNGSCSNEYEKASIDYCEYAKNMVNSDINVKQVAPILENLLSKKDLKEYMEFYGKLDAIRSKLNGSDISEETYSEIISLCGDQLLTHLITIQDTLKDEIKSEEETFDEEKQKENEENLKRYKYKKWVHENIQSIQDNINIKVEEHKLSDALQYVRTNKITTEANQLANELITDAYIKRFNTEIKQLAPELKIVLEKVQSQKGHSPYKIFLDVDSKIRNTPEVVLSEGEQHIVALAGFLANVTGRQDSTPIIIDDPISSLDSTYEEKVAERIVNLAKTRQVIIFTHRIPFLVTLKDKADKTNVLVESKYIRSGNSGKGLPDFEDEYHGSIREQLNGVKETLFKEKKKDHDSHEYKSTLSDACKTFRLCIERSVEEILLDKMITRYDNQIHTKGKIYNLTRITEEDCQIIDDMMSKYSIAEHSQPMDRAQVMLSIDEIIEDISNFIDWINDYNKRVNGK